MIEAYFDGCCEPRNPGGHAAAGIIIFQDGNEIFRAGRYVCGGPSASNNVAEYAGICAILKYIQDMDLQGPITIRGDSKLVIEQLSGRWRVNGGLYLPYYEKARLLLGPLKNRVTLIWIPREQNDVCDELSKQVLKDRGVVFRIQPERP